MTDLFLTLAQKHYCPTVAEIAEELGVTTGAVTVALMRLHDNGGLYGTVTGDGGDDQDVVPEDLPALLTALGISR